MADTGTIVTDAEVLSFIPGSGAALSDILKFLVKDAEDVVQKHCNRIFAEATYTSEEYLINPVSDYNSGIVSRPVQEFSLRQSPVSSITSIKQITSRSATDGTVLTTETINHNAYRLIPNSSTVRFTSPLGNWKELSSPLPNITNYQVYPNNDDVVELQVTYKAGYAAASIPYSLKSVVLQVVTRTYQLQQQSGFHKDSVEGEIGTINYKRVEFTPEEYSRLTPFIKITLG